MCTVELIWRFRNVLGSLSHALFIHLPGAGPKPMYFFQQASFKSALNHLKSFLNNFLSGFRTFLGLVLRICLPMQETWVQSLVLEDPKQQGATKPMHNNGTYALQLLKPWGPRTLLHNKRRHCNEKTDNGAAQEFRAEVNKFKRTWGFTSDKSDGSTNQGKNSHLKRINISFVCDPSIICQQNLTYIYI